MSLASYSVNNVPQAITKFFLTHIRIVAHTLGAVTPGAQLSQNHWSIYLIHSNGCVRLNMQLRNISSTSSRGLLTITNHGYTTVSTSAVNSWDFLASQNLSVWYVIQLIRDNGRQNYDMTAGGVGCRYWVSVVFADLVSAGYVSATSTDGPTVDSVIQYNYSIGQAPIALEMRRGRFLQESQTTSGATHSSSETASGSSSLAHTMQTASYNITTWSAWAWSSERGQWYRTRADNHGGWDYEYADATE